MQRDSLIAIDLNMPLHSTSMAERCMIDVSHVSRRGSSLRITIPKKVSEKLGIGTEDIIGFYFEEGKVVVEKVK